MPHAHASAAGEHRGRLLVVLGLGTAALAAQLVGGWLTGSLALLADAAHNVTDVAGIGLSLLAVWMAGRPPTDSRTFGFLRLEILSAVANGLLLLAVAVVVLVEAVQRLGDPPAVAAMPMLAFAAVGLAANGVSLAVLRDAQRHSLNIRGAYLEVVGDLAGSVAVIAAAVVIGVTGWTPADALASVAIAVLIVPRALRLLREATDILLEATPRHVDLDEVRRHILDARGVADVHDLHAWTITSGMNVVSAHVVPEPGAVAARCSMSCAGACRATSISSTRPSSSRPRTGGGSRSVATPDGAAAGGS